MHAHDEPRRAEPALQAVRLTERLLHRAERPVGGTDALDRDDVGALGLHREHQARPHRVAVDEHGARAADPVLAPEVRTGEREVFAQEVGKRLARLRRARGAARR